MTSQCLALSNCLGIAAIRDYSDYVPALISREIGLSLTSYRSISIVFPVLTTTGSYLVMWTKCIGESRQYRDMPEPFCTKWSWTKIMTHLAPAVVISQLWSSIPYSKYIYPVEAYELMAAQMINLDCITPIYVMNEAQEISDRFVYIVNKSLSSMPKVLGTTTLLFSIFMSFQLMISCCENRRFGKRDAFILAMQVSSFILSILQLKMAGSLDYAPYVNTDLNSCREQFISDAYNDTYPVQYSCPCPDEA